MNADAIIFDKDGTLIDFDAFWVTVSIKALEDVLKTLNRTDVPICEILEAFGVRDGVTEINGVLCKGTYEQMGEIVHGILSKYGCDISRSETISLVIDAYNRNAEAGEVKPICPDLPEVLTELKKSKKLAVVTTDNEQITLKCLKKLGIDELFDKIYTDDGKTPTKPNPFCAIDFEALSGVKRERMIMVGDTMTDVKFARNAGIAVVCVAKTEKNRAILSPVADAVISDLSTLPSMLK